MEYKYGQVLTRKDVEKLPIPKPGSTDPAIPDKPYHAKSGNLPGVTCAVAYSGAKSFHLYGRTRSGKPFRMFLGRYPIIGPAEADKAAMPLIARRDAGGDPAAELKEKFENERRERGETLEELVPKYLKDKADLPTYPDIKAIFRRDITPCLSMKLPLLKVTQRDVAEMVDALVDRSGNGTARKAFAYLSSLYSWAGEKGLMAGRPWPGEHVKPPEAGERDRTLDDAEIKLIWHAAEASRLGQQYGSFVRLLVLLGNRRNELTDMQWPELDLAKTEWLIPASRMKGKKGKRREHLVLLPPTAVKIIDAMPRITSYVFPAPEAENRGITDSARVKRELLAEMAKLDPELTAKMPRWTWHDCRRTMSTRMPGLGIDDNVVERCIAHVVGSKVKRIYNRYDYQKEKRAAWALWDAEVNRIVGPQLTLVAATGTE